MKTVINLNINNLIRGYCSNFLSYLYAKNGWERTTFELGKKIIIPSCKDNDIINIFIANSGSIIINCYCMGDILKSIEFIMSEFENSRMLQYCIFDKDVIINTNFTSTIPVHETFYLDVDHKNIDISQNIATLEYKTFEEGDKLISIINQNYIHNQEDIDDDSTINNMFVEKLLFSFLMVWGAISFVKII